MGAAQSSSSSSTTALSSDRDNTQDSNVATQDNVAPSPPKSSTQTTLLSQHHHKPYKAPTSPIHPLAHYIFLVHGWLGNDLEMGYLSESFAKCIAKEGVAATNGEEEEQQHDAKRIKRSDSQLAAHEAALKASAGESTHPPVVVHSVKCNVGKTHDGIKKGGTRLAHEIVEFIQTDLQKLQSDTTSSAGKDGHVTYSIVGNSLGGLYARYAISLIPRQLCIPRSFINNTDGEDATSSQQRRIHVHPNTFLTTATPHLGVSQHTYLPLPRIAETIIGSGMGITGTDLFRLNSDKTGRENVIGANVRKWSGAQGVLGPWRNDKPIQGADGSSGMNSTDEEEIDQEMECIIRNMCLQEKYLGPLRNFQRRIAYANAYRTDFQVPTETAAFLNADSNVVHTVIACRDVVNADDEGKRDREDKHVPPFVVAVVMTEQQPFHPDKTESISVEELTPKEELLQMSQSLDALGWTKVFIDVRSRIPLPYLPKPSWRLLPFPSVLSTMLPEPDTPLDDLIHRRGFKKDSNTSSDVDDGAAAVESTGSTEQDGVTTTVTSSELIQSTNAGQTVHFPMG